METPVKPVKKSSAALEKMMGILTAVFFGGVLLYAFLPEGPVRGSTIAVFSCGTYMLLYRWLFPPKASIKKPD